MGGLTSVAGSLGPDRASFATSSKRDPVDSEGVDASIVVDVSSGVLGADFLLIHCGRILAKFDALLSALIRGTRHTFELDMPAGGYTLVGRLRDRQSPEPLIVSNASTSVHGE